VPHKFPRVPTGPTASDVKALRLHFSTGATQIGLAYFSESPLTCITGFRNFRFPQRCCMWDVTSVYCYRRFEGS